MSDASSAAASLNGLRGLRLRLRYSSDSDNLLNDFYVPALSRAIRYDRIAGYFASSAFVSAAAGLARFVNGGGMMRMIVGARLSDTDCEALQGSAELDSVLAQRLNASALIADDMAHQRLQIIAWLVRQGRLEIRVGVPCSPIGVPLASDHPDNDGRYFHTKSGILYDDAGDMLTFSGSINESLQGWSRNFEQFKVYMSWKAESWSDYGKPEAQHFERLWNGNAGPGWRIIELPEAFKSKLIDIVPDDYEPPAVDPAEQAPPEQVSTKCTDPEALSETDRKVRKVVAEIRDAPATGTGVGLVSAVVEPWPHQLAIARRVLDTWPRSYLLADQVGLGKTIEVGLILRELLLSGRATRALILVPASLLIQWQQELQEKFCLDVPRLDGTNLVFSDPSRRRPIKSGSNPWAAEPLLLASSHLARRRTHRQRLLNAPNWDLIVVDEAHHARRSGLKPDSNPNQMLVMLRELKKHSKFKALLLASATPMQMHPRELWDLLQIVGLPEHWASNDQAMARYFQQLSEPFNDRDWDFLRSMVKSHLSEAGDPSDKRTSAALDSLGAVAQHRIRNFADNGLRGPQDIKKSERSAWDEWLRACTPVRDRVFRTTRITLRSYVAEGRLASGTVIPERKIRDHFDDLGEATALYERIDRYIRARYAAYSASRDKRARGMGFIMTVYRRRLTSSFHAINSSLKRRRQALINESPAASLLDDDDRNATEDALWMDGLDDLDDSLFVADADSSETDNDVQLLLNDIGGLKAELDEIDSFVAELDALPRDEPKMQRLAKILSSSFTQGHRSVVIFTQYSDTLHYIRDRLRGTYRNGLACYYGGAGEIWDNTLCCWSGVGKEHIKSQFRCGEIQILIGTDSMSEGLNLQTCDVMVNFDLPWNFTRVEQRIGRLDRIGGMERITVHNLYYSGTVEVDIYERLRERFDSFENVLGTSAPVLAAMEHTLKDAAMGKIGSEKALEQINESIQIAEDAPISLDDLDAVPEPANELAPYMTLDGLRDKLLSLPVVADLLKPDPQRHGVWYLTQNTQDNGIKARKSVAVAFDPKLCTDYDDVALLTWGSPLLDELLRAVDPAAEF